MTMVAAGNQLDPDLLAYVQQRLPKLKALFDDSDRVASHSGRVGQLYFDLSKQRIDQRAWSALQNIGEQRGLATAIAQLFQGVAVNRTEQRAALHWLLRAPASDVPAALQNTAADMQRAHSQMRAIDQAIHTARAADVGLVQPNAIVNIGIGGSDLGPRLAFHALQHTRKVRHSTHFVANVDAHSMHQLLQRLDAKSTLFIVASKSFNTQETLLNAKLARQWLLQNGVAETALSQHFLAVSSNVKAAEEFGIRADHVLPMSDTVGGRYSLWSSVGLVTCLAIGWDQFAQMLAGAALMDRHFRDDHNWIIRLAMLGYFNADYLSHATHAVIPYDDRLSLLPEYLQQLEMESNGKSTTLEGTTTDRSTPVMWGGAGTNVQHAFFQAIHQGAQVVPIDFVGVVKPDHPHAAQHQVLLANLLAQSAALLSGKSLAEVKAALPELTDAMAQHRVFSGNRPSTTILLDSLNPYSFGQLLATYENKVYAQSVLWQINAFDQWGVELGKVLANTLLPAVTDTKHVVATDASTRQLLAELHRQR
jgi:glucose-6-phosphate isomerase